MSKQNKKITLLVDAGNSAVKWALLDVNGLTPMRSELYPETISSDFFIGLWKALEKPGDVMVSCVADEAVWQAMETASEELWDVEMFKVSANKQTLGLNNAYGDFNSLGSDRWCSMIAARHLAEGAFMVVSAGSALTVDVVNESGQHKGGYILPGLGMMRKSLSSHTAKVAVDPKINQMPSLSLANSTSGCVEAGIHLSVVSLIQAVYEKESSLVDNIHCYLTGGNAKVIANLLTCQCEVIPDMVLRGLVNIQKNI